MKTSSITGECKLDEPQVQLQSQVVVSAANQFDCIIPAAGMSSRMGDWKMMLAYKHGTILDISIENALKNCARVILVVGHNGEQLKTRYGANKSLYKDRLVIVDNPDYKLGMFSSIQKGVAEVKSRHFYISHGDMPCIDGDVFAALALEVSPGPSMQAEVGQVEANQESANQGSANQGSARQGETRKGDFITDETRTGDISTCENVQQNADVNQSSIKVVFPGTLTQTGHPVLLPAQSIATIMAADSNSKMKPLLKPYDCQYLNLSSPCIYQDVDTPEAYKRLLDN